MIKNSGGWSFQTKDWFNFWFKYIHFPTTLIGFFIMLHVFYSSLYFSHLQKCVHVSQNFDIIADLWSYCNETGAMKRVTRLNLNKISTSETNQHLILEKFFYHFPWSNNSVQCQQVKCVATLSATSQKHKGKFWK